MLRPLGRLVEVLFSVARVPGLFLFSGTSPGLALKALHPGNPSGGQYQPQKMDLGTIARPRSLVWTCARVCVSCVELYHAQRLTAVQCSFSSSWFLKPKVLRPGNPLGPVQTVWDHPFVAEPRWFCSSLRAPATVLGLPPRALMGK